MKENVVLCKSIFGTLSLAGHLKELNLGSPFFLFWADSEIVYIRLVIVTYVQCYTGNGNTLASLPPAPTSAIAAYHLGTAGLQSLQPGSSPLNLAF